MSKTCQSQTTLFKFCEVSEYVKMLPARFDDVDGHLSIHNVGNIFGLLKILTVMKLLTLCFTRNLITLVFRVGPLSVLIP